MKTVKHKTEEFREAFDKMDEVLAGLESDGNIELRDKLYEAMKLLTIRPA